MQSKLPRDALGTTVARVAPQVDSGRDRRRPPGQEAVVNDVDRYNWTRRVLGRVVGGGCDSDLNSDLHGLWVGMLAANRRRATKAGVHVAQPRALLVVHAFAAGRTVQQPINYLLRQ